MGEPAEKIISDPGFDITSQNLSAAKINKTINKVLSKEGAFRLRVYLQTCAHCGLCAEACHFYLSNGNDPRFSPMGKVKQTLGEIFIRKGNVDADFLKECARIAYTECNLCRRCSMHCPFGIDMAYLLLLVRRICGQLGVVPQFLQDTVNSHAATLNQMWVKQDEWIDTLQWQEDDARDELKHARIPLNKEGAEIMYSVIGPEPVFLPQLIGNIITIMNVGGIDWTMPTFDGWDNSNMAMYSGDFETMVRVERRHFEAALKLKAKRIVMCECGHAFRGAVYDGPRWISWKEPPVPLIHAIQFYYELLQEGRIKIAHKHKGPITVHDPCNVVRGRGLGDMLRHIMHATCEDFRDVSPRHEHNYCCGAGGGVINCGPPWKPVRMKASMVKAKQLMATGAQIVVTPCHNCHSGIEDIIDYHKLGMKVKFLSEILVDAMEIPEELRA